MFETLRQNTIEYFIFAVGSGLLVLSSYVQAPGKNILVVIGFLLDMYAFHLTMRDIEDTRESAEEISTTIGLNAVPLGNAMEALAEVMELEMERGNSYFDDKMMRDAKDKLLKARYDMEEMHKKLFLNEDPR